MELKIILFLVVSLLHLASCAPMGLYGFAQPVTGNTPWTFVRLDPPTGNTTALWKTPLNLEPYVAALDAPRKVVYAVAKQNTIKGVSSTLVALSLENGTQLYNVSLPFKQYASTVKTGLGHSAGTDSGTIFDLDALTGDVLVGGIIQPAVHWHPSTSCTSGCNASKCCEDPLSPGAACFVVKQCADISEPNGTAYFKQYKMYWGQESPKSLEAFEQPQVYWPDPTKAGSSAFDPVNRTLYVQLQVDTGSTPTSSAPPMQIFAFDIDTGKIRQSINVSHALHQAKQNDSTIFDFEDMNWDPKTKRLLSVSLGTFQNSTLTQFVRCLVALDPVSHNMSRLSPHYWDLKHNDRIGVNSCQSWTPLPAHLSTELQQGDAGCEVCRYESPAVRIPKRALFRTASRRQGQVPQTHGRDGDGAGGIRKGDAIITP